MFTLLHDGDQTQLDTLLEVVRGGPSRRSGLRLRPWLG